MNSAARRLAASSRSPWGRFGKERGETQRAIRSAAQSGYARTRSRPADGLRSPSFVASLALFAHDLSRRWGCRFSSPCFRALLETNRSAGAVIVRLGAVASRSRSIAPLGRSFLVASLSFVARNLSRGVVRRAVRSSRRWRSLLASESRRPFRFGRRCEARPTKTRGDVRRWRSRRHGKIAPKTRRGPSRAPVGSRFTRQARSPAAKMQDAKREGQSEAQERRARLSIPAQKREAEAPSRPPFETPPAASKFSAAPVGLPFNVSSQLVLHVVRIRR